MTRKKFLRALKFTAEKSCLKIGGKNQRPHASLLSLFLPCSTVYNQGILSMFHCPNKVK